jgi:hypothetical protein
MHNGEQKGEPKIDLESLVWLLGGHDQLAEAWLDLAGKRAVPFLLFTGVRGRGVLRSWLYGAPTKRDSQSASATS